jgi:hypothetical protein
LDLIQSNKPTSDDGIGFRTDIDAAAAGFQFDRCGFETEFSGHFDIDIFVQQPDYWPLAGGINVNQRLAFHIVDTQTLVLLQLEPTAGIVVFFN